VAKGEGRSEGVREVGRVFERAVGFRESEGSRFARKRGCRLS